MDGIIDGHALCVVNGLTGKQKGVITRERHTVSGVERSVIDLVIMSSDMTKHIENNHCLECGKCADVFLSENTLELHIKTNHAIINHQKTYPCEKCNFVFKSSERFDKHISGLQHNKVEKHDDSDYEDDSDDEEYVDSCSFCKAVLRSYEETDDHQSNYIRCEKCNVCFHNEFQWEDHVKCDIF